MLCRLKRVLSSQSALRLEVKYTPEVAFLTEYKPVDTCLPNRCVCLQACFQSCTEFLFEFLECFARIKGVGKFHILNFNITFLIYFFFCSFAPCKVNVEV